MELFKYIVEFVNAIQHDDLGRLEYLLKKHPKHVNDTDSHEKYSALGWACKYRKVDCVNLICQYADVDKLIGWNQSTALMKSVESGHMAIIEMLLRYGADINIQNQFGMTCLMFAAEYGHVAVVEKLLNHDYSDLMNPELKPFRARVNVNAVNNDKYTALILAAGRGHTDVVSLITSSPDVDVGMKNKFGINALMAASKSGHLECVKLLCQWTEFGKLGARYKVDEVSIRGRTALMYASREGHIDVVKYLCLEARANPSTVSNYKSALSLACSGGHTDVVSFLMSISEMKDNFFAFFAACESGQADTAALLIKKISLSAFCRTIDTGESCLMAACRHGHIAVIILLLDKIEEFKSEDVNAIRALQLLIDKEGFSAINCLARYFSHNEDRFKAFIRKSVQCYDTKPYLLEQLPHLLPYSKSPNRIINDLKQEIVSKLYEKTGYDSDLYLVSALINIAAALKASAELHEIEAIELLAISSEFEDAAFESMFSTTMDYPENVTKVLMPKHSTIDTHTEEVSQAGAFFEGPLHECMRYDLTKMLSTAQVVTFVHGRFYGCLHLFHELPIKNISDFFQLRTGIISARYAPYTVFFFEAIMKVFYALLVSIHVISFKQIDDEFRCIDDFSGYFLFSCEHRGAWERLIYFFTITSAIYEMGEILHKSRAADDMADVMASAHVRVMSAVSHLLDRWNMLDVLSVVFISVWAFQREDSPLFAHMNLSLAAITLVLSSLRFYTLSQHAGQLMLMVFEILKGLGSFISVLFSCMLGFGIVFRCLFPQAKEFDSTISTFLTLVDSALGAHDFTIFAESPHESNGIKLMIFYKILVTIVILNLIVARMSATHDNINENSLEVWSKIQAVNTQQYILLRERNVFCVLPAPLNILSIIGAILEYIHKVYRSAKRKRENVIIVGKRKPLRLKSQSNNQNTDTNKLLNDLLERKIDANVKNKFYPSIISATADKVVSLIMAPIMAVYEIYLANRATALAPVPRWVPLVVILSTCIQLPVFVLMFFFLILWCVCTEPLPIINEMTSEIHFLDNTKVRRCFTLCDRYLAIVYLLAACCVHYWLVPSVLQFVSLAVATCTVQVIDSTIVSNSYVRSAFNVPPISRYNNLQNLIIKKVCKDSFKLDLSELEYLHCLTIAVHCLVVAVVALALPYRMMGCLYLFAFGLLLVRATITNRCAVACPVSASVQAPASSTAVNATPAIATANAPANTVSAPADGSANASANASAAANASAPASAVGSADCAAVAVVPGPHPNTTPTDAQHPLILTKRRMNLSGLLAPKYTDKDIGDDGVMNVNIIRAELSVSGKSIFQRKANPYVVATYPTEKGDRVQYTDTKIRGGTSVMWSHQTCRFQLEPNHHIIKFAVYDRIDVDSDDSTCDELLCWTNPADIKEWVANNRFEGWLPLVNHSGPISDKIQLDVKIQYRSNKKAAAKAVDSAPVEKPEVSKPSEVQPTPAKDPLYTEHDRKRIFRRIKNVMVMTTEQLDEMVQTKKKGIEGVVNEYTHCFESMRAAHQRRLNMARYQDGERIPKRLRALSVAKLRTRTKFGFVHSKAHMFVKSWKNIYRTYEECQKRILSRNSSRANPSEVKMQKMLLSSPKLVNWIGLAYRNLFPSLIRHHC